MTDVSSGTKPDTNKEHDGNVFPVVLFSRVRERIRTPDLLVRSQTLYPAELHALTLQLTIVVHPISFVNTISHEPSGNRTLDNLIKSQVLYRLS